MIPALPLVDGWRHLLLAAQAEERVIGWDAVVVTASSAAQGAVYRERLRMLQQAGRWSARTRVVVVEDPEGPGVPPGHRIGSGGATLHALRGLAAALSSATALARARILLVHAGGDSRRLPWGSVVGKAFIPMPVVTDPDQPCPTVLEHLAALTATVPRHFTAGGMLVLSGDVLPLADLGALAWPSSGVAVVAVPVPAALASRHGVIASDAAGQVTDVLQKPDLAQLHTARAVLPGGQALLDSGVWSFTGSAMEQLCALATASADPLRELIADGRECSLYEEFPAACLPARAQWLSTRPLGGRLATALGGQPFVALRAAAMRFLHLGTGSEWLEHLAADWSGHASARVLADCAAGIDAAAFVIESQCAPSVRIGAGSVIAYARLDVNVRIGRRCVIMGYGLANAADHQPPVCELALPDHHALWQVPMRGPNGGPNANVVWVNAWCGVDDNPKALLEDQAQPATLGNRRFSTWMEERGIMAVDLWGSAPPSRHSLWFAKLFTAASRPGLLQWMIHGDAASPNAALAAWRAEARWSLAELAAGFCPSTLIAVQQQWRDTIVEATVERAIALGMDRDVAALTGHLSPTAATRAAAMAIPDHGVIPAARRAWLRADLLQAIKATAAIASARHEAWAAISADMATRIDRIHCAPISAITHDSETAVRLPARVDLGGGWTDTPPICCEHPARVFNLAVNLDGAAPIGASAAIMVSSPAPGVVLELVGTTIAPLTLAWSALRSDVPLHLDDPYALFKAVLLTCGWEQGAALNPGTALRLSGWSHLPKGSGLGASSILAAALVRAVQQVAGRSDDVATVSALVLMVEQRLSTGGGWQDQMGGLVPGAKLLSSLPLSPLRIQIEPVPLSPDVRRALHERLVVIDTGITRLAKDVLQRVIGGYLSRRHRVLAVVRRLAEVAVDTRDCVAVADWAGLDACLRETWSLNQALDPHCSNPAVDALFHDVPGAWKLTGAGGGGFAVWLAPDGETAVHWRPQLIARGARCPQWGLADSG